MDVLRRHAGVLALFALIQFAEPENKSAMAERWEWDGKVLGCDLKTAFAKQQPLVAVTASGCIPYWSELPALDMLGLNDYYLPRHRPDDMGEGSLGHELGDEEYVLNCKPDIIVFNLGYDLPKFPWVPRLMKMEEFRELYAPSSAAHQPPAGRKRFYGFENTAIKSASDGTPTEITIPGFLFNANPDTIAFFREGGELVAPCRPATPPPSIFAPMFLSGNGRRRSTDQHPEQVHVQIQRPGNRVAVVLTSRQQNARGSNRGRLSQSSSRGQFPIAEAIVGAKGFRWSCCGDSRRPDGLAAKMVRASPPTANARWSSWSARGENFQFQAPCRLGRGWLEEIG